MTSVLFATLVLSCTPVEIARMDRAVRNAPKAEAALRDSLLTLKKVLRNADSEDIRWEAAKTLYDIYSHYQLDSCLSYAELLTRLSGDNPDRRVMAGTAHARAVFSLGSYSESVDIYERADTCGASLAGETGDMYYTVGSWIYKGIGNAAKREEAENAILMRGEGFIEAVKLRYEDLCAEKHYDEAVSLLEHFLECKTSLNEYARAHYYLAQVYRQKGERDKEVSHLVLSACADMEGAIKNYNSLYQLALILYEEGDLERAAAYIQKNLDDALFSNSSSRLLRSARSELIFSEALQRSQRARRLIQTIVFLLTATLALVLVVMTLRLRRSSRRLARANRDINDLSRIKDGFLAQYMELSAGYIGEVDETKRRLRRTLKKDGPEALAALLRSASYADSEYANFYRCFDKTFLGIYPDFVEKVNSLMRPDRQFETEAGQLSSALRILALIRLGITSRTRIAKILNIGLSTVYTYHSHFLRDALPSDRDFDDAIRALE